MVVRKLPLAVVGSVGLHAVIFAGVQIWAPAERPEPPPEPVVFVEIVEAAADPAQPAPALAQPAAAPAQAAQLPPTPPRAAAQQVSARSAPGPDRVAAIETSSVESTDPAAAPARSRWFDLRGGRGPTPDLRLPGGLYDPAAAAAPAAAPAAAAAASVLQEAGGGSYRSNQGPFTAKVAPDGSVSLRDARNLQVHLALPKPKQIGQAISDWYRSDKGPYGQTGERTLEKSAGGSIDGGDRSRAVIVPVVGGGFDITDAFMRRKGGDPYASKKLAFLDATRDERVQIGAQHRARQLKLTPQIVQRNLEQAWQSTAEPRARRAALFELWDEIVETGDAQVVEAGRTARKLVIGFVRARLPAGGPDAYTAGELAALNRGRQSKEAFAPYEDASN